MAEENTTNNQEQAADRKEDKDWADAIKVRGGEEVSPAAGDGGDSKILNQEEIDSLFGYTPDEEDEDYEMKTGVRAILNASMVSYERLPMLDIVFDRLIRMMATSLRNFTQLSCVKLRSDVAIMRIRRSNTMSSIGRRS